MRCYFLRDNRIAGVEILPLGLSDEDAIARAHTVSSKRKGPIEAFEVWDRARSSSGITCRLAPIRSSPLRARRRQPQNDLAMALAGPTHLTEPIDELAIEPDTDQAIGAYVRRCITRPK
jgi:hypothetical protein